MESETSNIMPEADENVHVSVEESKESVPVEKVEQEENIVNNTVINKQPAAVVHEALFPDVTRFNYDVQYGYRIFCELSTDQYKSITRPFYEPVDVEALGLWDYNTRIETPMSFKQIESKFMNYSYQGITEIISDMRLILENCYRYNGSDHWISKLAQKLEKILDQKLALLNRSLRGKVTLQATMAFRNNKEIIPESEELGVHRRRSGRSSYSNTMNGDQTSRLVSQLILENEEAQKELKRLKEKEKKEATEALLQELNEWENEIFTPDVLIELQSMWEIPSIGCFLWLFREALNLPELNFKEFESGLVIPHKSRVMASIFSVLLCTANQRKSFHKKPPMKFAVWEKKLKERMDLWYMTREAEEFQLVAHQIGLDHEFFEILGNSNPLEKKSYLDLSLHQRVLILKALCDECLDYEPQMRDYLGSAEVTPFRESILGSDESNCSYVYFPIFDATDIRIYKQAPMPSAAEWYRKWTTASKAVSSHSKSGRPRQPKSKKSGSRSKESCTSIKDGFELVCFDIETLRGLCEKFSDQTSTPSGKKRRGRPMRKRSEIGLHNVLTSLLEELVPAEGKYSRARTKGMLNLMKDWKTEEEVEEETNDSDEESFTQDRDEVGDPLEECQATPMITKPTLEKQDIHSEPQQLTEQRPWGEDAAATNLLSAGDNSDNHFVNSNGNCSLSSMVTRSKQKTTKRMLCVKKSSTPLLETDVSRNNDNSNDIQSELPEISSLSENLDTTDDVHTNDSETVLSGKTEIITDVGQGLFPEKVVVSMNSDSAAQVMHIPELEIQNGGTKEDCGGSKDTYGIMGSCDDHKDISTEDTKDNQLNGMQDNGCNVSTQGNPEGESISSISEVDNRDSHDNQEQLSKKTSIENRCKTNSVDIIDNKECEGTSVYENGICNDLGDICNGAQSEENYEPSIKRHCSADNHIPTSLPTGNGLDDISLETSHLSQSSVKPTINNEVQNYVTALETESAKNCKTMSLPAGNELGVSMETSHQSPVKAMMGEDVENHVLNLTSPVG